jgi:hypothetical protein
MYGSRCLVSFLPVFILTLATSVSVFSAPTIEWQPEHLHLHKTPGATINETLTVKFSKDAATLTYRLSPEIDEWLAVSAVVQGDVLAGQSLQLSLTGFIPADAPIATQRGVLQIISGLHQMNLAKPLPIAISVVEGGSDGLPPDPGEAGKKTLMGIDSDGDGLRDDIQRYIYLTYPDQPNVQGGLRQLALSLQKTLDSGRENGTGRKLANEIHMGMECVSSFVGDELYNVLQRLKAEVVNTYDRTRQYLDYDKELSGGVFSGSGLPINQTYKLCDFAVEA